MKLTFDFETRSEADLKKVGAWEYSLHPTTEILCMAYKLEDQPTQILTYFDEYCGIFLSASTYEAHNAFFERSIYTNILVKKHNWPEIPHTAWRCSMAKAAAVGLPPGLANLAQVLGLKEGKDLVGNRLMLQMSKPRPDWNKHGDYKTTKDGQVKKVEKWFEEPEKLERLYAYCIQDVEVEHQVSSKLPDLSPYELKTWQLDQTINLRGLYIDRSACLAALDLTHEVQKRNNARCKHLTGSATTQPNNLRNWLNENHSLNLPDFTAETVQSTLVRDDLHPTAREVLTLRLETAQTSTRRVKPMLDTSASDNRARDQFRYHAATQTGRWGGKKIQPHNLPRG